MVKRKSKRQRDIKSKLMAAICMLLVSSIMMVSSTYAWFTLSTAPEVTGIQTAVGANGNLEMALLPKEGDASLIQSGVGDSSATTGQTVAASNITWGNLVDLTDTNTYGLDKIMLYPSALNVQDSGAIDVAALLQTPTYGADGRVNELAFNTVTGVYTKGGFTADELYGVRAVGVASGMTERELSYRNSASTALSAMKQAQTEIVTSLTNNGANLANIAIERGLNGTETGYTADQMGYLDVAVTDLEDALDYIETAYMQYILTYAASAASGNDTAGDAKWTAVKTLVEADNATLTSVVAGLTDAGVTIPSEVFSFVTVYNDLVADVAAARAAIPTGDDADGDYTWDEISDVLDPLMNTSLMTVNGYTIAEVKANKQLLVDDYLATGRVTLTMVSGSGVYADIADQVGDYTASIKMSIDYNGMALNNVPAAMTTDSSITPPYVEQFGTVAKAGKPVVANTTNPISEFYGFVIDLAFRTNAANSNLMLQQDAVDRIYSDNTNETTMGHGSSMTFKATDVSFTNEQMLGLMDAIRVVFFNPDSGEIVARAKLDTAAGKYTVGTDGITAKLSLCTEIGDVTYSYVQDDAGTYKNEPIINYVLITEDDFDGQRYAWDSATSAYVKADDGGYKAVVTDNYVEIEADEEVDAADRYKQVATESETATLLADQTIMALTQNTAHALSALVYLDGNKMSNEDVAIGASSMTGSLNLQFSSDATLVPMEYAALHQPAGGTNTPTEEENAG